jgi:phenylalanyl-tRNA synthetase beta chain
MGGAASAVSDTTDSVYVEAAFWWPQSIAGRSRRFNFSTDAGHRFERGVDPDLTLYALKRCIYLLQQITEAKQHTQLFTFEGNTAAAISLELNLQQVKQLIGTALDTSLIKRILTDLDFEILEEQANHLQVRVPRYRVDVTRPVDVIEEILRIYGLNQVPLPEKWNFSLPVRPRFYPEKHKESICEFLVGRGYSEILNNSLTKLAYAEKISSAKLEQAIQILNPLSQDLGILRQSLLFGLLECLQYNQNRQQSNLRIFEFGQHYIFAFFILFLKCLYT